MKMRLMLVMMFLVATTPMIFGQIVNGSFEDGINPGSFATIYAVDNTSITGWTVDGGSVDYIGSYWVASDGNRSLDMSGFFTVGSISQAITTVPGITYQVSFDLSGNPEGPPPTKTLTVAATGTAAATYNYAIGTNTLSDMQWESKTYSFRAMGTSTTLTFASPDSSAYGPALDNVAMNALYGTVCHRNRGKAPFKTMTLDLSSFLDHIGHGDAAGPCGPVNPS